MEECVGRLDDLSTIANVPFRASTILVAIAVIIALASICAMLLFFFCQSTTVFYICGWMQVVSGEYPHRVHVPGGLSPAEKLARPRLHNENRPARGNFSRMRQITISTRFVTNFSAAGRGGRRFCPRGTWEQREIGRFRAAEHSRAGEKCSGKN